jgi:hypothetical protein
VTKIPNKMTKMRDKLLNFSFNFSYSLGANVTKIFLIIFNYVI